MSEIQNKMGDLYNSLPEAERKKAGIGYSLAQLTTIMNLRRKNKHAWQAQDRKLAEWQKNIEEHCKERYLNE